MKLTVEQVQAACAAIKTELTINEFGLFSCGSAMTIQQVQDFADRHARPPIGPAPRLVAVQAPAGYESLVDILQRAVDQASKGKGADRHANGLPFHQQPMQRISDAVGVGFCIGQAMKKAEESLVLPPGADIAELLGAINYLAGAVLYHERCRAMLNDNTQDASANNG